MSTQTHTVNALDNSSSSKEDANNENISQDYEKLNEKCDTVITKIKKRKEKQSKKKN